MWLTHCELCLNLVDVFNNQPKIVMFKSALSSCYYIFLSLTFIGVSLCSSSDVSAFASGVLWNYDCSKGELGYF